MRRVNRIGMLVMFFIALGSTGPVLADRVDDLVKRLESKTAKERRDAALELGRVADPRAIRPLIGLLRDEEPMVRLDASGALIDLGRPVVEPLAEAIRSEEHPSFLWNAIRVLEQIGDPRAIGAIEEVSRRHKDPSIQQISQFALEKLKRVQKP